ncbi:MAG: aspartate kinase, partial [Gammaproteobacteria bacterium]
MWIVKLGGSLAQNPALKDWLEVLARDGAGRVVVVPGGGPSA